MLATRSFKCCMQCATCTMVSACLCRALKFLSTRDSKIKAEAVRWPEGKTLRLEIPGARGFTVTGTKAGFKKLHPSAPGDVTIRFKSPADAFRVFTGQISVAQAYAQHRFTLRGSMGLAMPFVRCVDIVETIHFSLLRLQRKVIYP